VFRKHEICEKKQADPVHRPITRLETENVAFNFSSFYVSLADDKNILT
jgi:hypothetical protein